MLSPATSSVFNFSLAVLLAIFVKFVIIFGIAIVIFALALLLVRQIPTADRPPFLECCIIVGGTSLIGSIVGDLSGSSQESVAGQLVPAILTLVGVFGMYVFGLERKHNPVVNVAVLAFVVALGISYAQASIHRSDDQAFMFCRDKISQKELYGDKDALALFGDIFGDYCGDEILRHTHKSN